MRKRFFGKKLATSALALLLATSVALSGCGKSNKSDNTKKNQLMIRQLRRLR